MITVTSVYDDDDGGRKVAEVARCSRKRWDAWNWREIAAGVAVALIVFSRWAVL